MTATYVGPQAQDLERMQRRLRVLSAHFLSLDMYERWGGGHDPSMNRALDEQVERLDEQRTLLARLEQKVTELQEAQSPALLAWADAHIALLDAWIAETNDKTSISVATSEKQLWSELVRGERKHVRHNTFHVTQSAALYEQLFGFPPGGAS